ncbi:MAG: PqqD family protein [Oscillospiraceae bacterium]|nr:PqqD family protein [Oscillospiraceae bacterium]
MKLRSDFITQDIDDTQFLVPVGAEAFSGIVRSNKTAAFIVDCLKEETTEEAIVDKMCAKYDADRNTITADVAEVIKTLRGINALEDK